MSKQKRPEYLVSTDSIGFAGTPDQFLFLWQDYFDKKIIDGVEVIAFKSLFRLKKLVKTLIDHRIPVVSFHGKTGGEDWLEIIPRIIMTMVNFCIIDAETLIKNFPEIDFLSHGPHFEMETVKNIIINNHPKKIWIENHLYGKKGLDEAVLLINRYRANKINANGMIDIYHYIAHSVENLNYDWPRIVSELQSYFKLKDTANESLFKGIHFPIGSRLDDSLPIDNMTDEMLELFAEKIMPFVERVVFENQQELPGLFFSTNKMLILQKERNRRIIERLKKTGIIL